ncbi:dimethylamine methyltransferase [Candidatus Formimonas warabiya]|uniref:Dimethylamine methyltransferase n=1 Tax=Formimonas warabiya TaxID=1761012 RepID=A0A3G1L0X3_FORW1|nr:dimethylamine methyltransferase [Candidatus Formimonas warabiya]
MAVTHEATAGMGGIRSAGDLVFRMELAGMKINEAKTFVAEKLQVGVKDLADCAVMKDVREDLNMGTTQSRPNAGVGIQTKFRIAEIMGISINSVEKFKKEAGI